MDNSKRRVDVWTFITIGISLIYIIFLVYPLLSLLKQSGIDKETGRFTLEYFRTFFAKKYYWGTVLNSLKVTSLVTLLSILIATPLAYIMTTFKIKGRSYRPSCFCI